MPFQMFGRQTASGSKAAVTFDVDMEPPAIVLASEFSRLALNIQSFKDPLEKAVKEVAAPSIKQNFEEGGRPPWEDFGDETLAHSDYDGHPLLIKTGELMADASSTQIWQIDKESAQVRPIEEWSDYGAFHQFGTINMPARPFLELQGEDEDAIEKVFLEWLGTRFLEAGFVAI
jgi:phage gpG-like protein